MINSNSIFNINNETEFEIMALKVFKFQFENNRVYRSFCDLLYKHPSDVKTIKDIPFLPIDFFKTRAIVCRNETAETVFTSSGTTGSTTSKHYVTNLEIYKESFRRGFSKFYGSIKDYTILALLPSYLEREGSSLVYMVNDLITQSKSTDSGFYLNNFSELKHKLIRLDGEGKKVLLVGVSFALMDIIEQEPFQLKNTIIMETGGMKGRRKELIRKELHNTLKKGFGVNTIHSEYGMTELLSQAYSKGNGIFNCPPWMRVFTRDTEDPLSLQGVGKAGGINVIDLANINSCAFIATQDLGRIYPDNSFEIIGRFDNSDVRGCNLMVL
ncbi:LuxE/PaaK family acyltransferase [Jejuia pallidilutea]|uniref:Long-chain-fatty-acid-luciferin-component ligase n=1 Tax=Jejuia pallidilutea TaxID=504487 RepID=A0A090WZC5_9FLAO|nr:acyltransferase [Jejuia pallidilutea]GAL67746.1 long-chain-fatty-acid-luciferin-component ligase [Jejuia pallidilutea]GAL72727.1 long-chain-fatty-acid-luciferin-component ligase [Jejuia pallidilutea]GAL88304.1 long-chain-fatty-acid-luciferin-component ligase [Jejuia pallidilutea]